MLQIEFDLSQFEGVEIVPLADAHCGHILFNEAEFKRLVDYIADEPDDPKMARVCILNGDLTESVTRHSVGNIFDQTMTPSVQVATMINYLKPLTEISDKYPMGKIVSYCAGNHDSGRYKDTGISASESIAVGLDLDGRYSTDGCYSFIKLKRQSDSSRLNYTVYNTHLSGGGISSGAKATKISRIGNAILASLIIGSHFHNPMTFKEDIITPSTNGKCYLKQDTITYVITGAFLRYGDYAQRNGMKPNTMATPRIFVKQRRITTKGINDRSLFTEVIL